MSVAHTNLCVASTRVCVCARAPSQLKSCVGLVFCVSGRYVREYAIGLWVYGLGLRAKLYIDCGLDAMLQGWRIEGHATG